MAYFLISVSNRINLDLCIKYALAGFTNSINGLWTFCEIEEGDFVSFIYGAKVFNLYRVKEKKAVRNAEYLPPWPPVTFKMSGKTYFFPFRVSLEPVRKFEEAMVRPEFAYVAENLLLRGGYRKTHFQADQTTLQSVSQMGYLCDEKPEPLNVSEPETFIPRFTWDKSKIFTPEVFRFQELILQTLLRHFLSNIRNLQGIFTSIGLNSFVPESFEILGEKALPEGHIDILIKESTPKGLSRKIIIEVKTANAKTQDSDQLCGYVKEIGDECLAGILIAGNFSKKALMAAKDRKVKAFTYGLGDIKRDGLYCFMELREKIQLNEM